MLYAIDPVVTVVAVVAFVAVAVVVALFCVTVFLWRRMVWMPGKRSRGPLPELDAAQQEVRADLRRDLVTLAQDIGERNVSQRYDQLTAAADFITRSLESSGYSTQRQEISVDGKTVWNIEAQRTGKRNPEQILVIGAHYDTVPGSPGANDNGTAVVANLALARAMAPTSPDQDSPDCTIRFVFFVNEESPYYMTQAMGSLRYAQACRDRSENIIGMVSLEMIGCFSDEANSQRYPIGWLGMLYPRTGNFVAVVGNVPSRRLVHTFVRGLRNASFPTEGMAAPSLLKDTFRSDHAAFWHCGYDALMITDTANFRYPHYHTAEDTVDKINFEMLTRLVGAIEQTLLNIVR